MLTTAGVYDKGIFKAFFLAGGAGSGKSYVSKQTMRGFGLKVVNSDILFEKLMRDADLSLRMPESERYERDQIRDRAKELTNSRHRNYVEGRLGIIIDGTGRDYAKIVGAAAKLKALGYDCYMIFVNTSLEVALARNEQRQRKVPVDIATKAWHSVQKKYGQVSKLFWEF